MQKSLENPVQYLKGVGPGRAKAFGRLGISTIEDLLYYFPRRYEDRSNFVPISKLQEGQTQTIKAEILTKRDRRSFHKRGFSLTEITAADETGKITCVWFNQPYLADYFKVGQHLILYGKIERYLDRFQMSSPEFEIVSQEPQDTVLNVGRIIPLFTLSEGITQRNFRRIMKNALDEYLAGIQDFLPYDIRARNNLLNLAKSLINIQFPENLDIQKQAYARLSFEDFFLFQIPLILRKQQKTNKLGIAHKVSEDSAGSFIESLPFGLTSAQEKVIHEIKQDMAAPKPMQRLLQGDVGSGKTVVATIASVIAIEGGCQAALMVPTEVLAKQHYEKINCQIAKLLNCQKKKINLALITGSATKKEKRNIYTELKNGKIDLVIGTHALLEESVKFKKLGLVVIDEQHKFGVGQRALLPAKGKNPDVLIMTATPIPRTLAITLYGDLDISVISELPPGRLPVKTLNFTQAKREQAYDAAERQLREGRQVYIIYPVIEESYALDISGAKKMYEELKSGRFKDFRLGLIHGKLKDQEQDETMLKFKNKEIDVLVSTTVLEVGIDVANATCMIVEHAERFGLSQLHQLRGRVGRGRYQSFCILISDAQTEEARQRLSAMAVYSDGFKIAEEDLKIRGPGQFFGRRQHGLTELKIGNPLTQMQLLKKAREEAIKLLSSDPHLQLRQNSLLRHKLLQRFPEYEKLMMVA